MERLVPDLSDTLTTPEDERPYSAAYPFVTTLNSWMASTDGLMISFCPEWLVEIC